MKALFCLSCGDIIAPHRPQLLPDPRWRWCDCGASGVRWEDAERGLLQVTAVNGPEKLRVLGLANTFLETAAGRDDQAPGSTDTMEEWRLLHATVVENVPANYLFHESKRECWAVVIAVGETSDVEFVPYRRVQPGGTERR